MWWRNILHISIYLVSCLMERVRCLIRHFMKRKWNDFAYHLSNRFVLLFFVFVMSEIEIIRDENENGDCLCCYICSFIMVCFLHTWGWGSRRLGTWCGYLSVWLKIRNLGFMIVLFSYFSRSLYCCYLVALYFLFIDSNVVFFRSSVMRIFVGYDCSESK